MSFEYVGKTPEARDDLVRRKVMDARQEKWVRGLLESPPPQPLIRLVGRRRVGGEGAS